MNTSARTSKKLTLTLLIILSVAMFIGCNRDNLIETPDETVVQTGMTLVSHTTSLSTLSGYLPNISNIIIDDDTIFFTSTYFTDRHSLLHRTRIFSADISDDENFVFAELTGYTVPPMPLGTEVGGVSITAMQVDSGGNIWIAESGSFYALNLPEGFDLNRADFEEIWEYYKNIEAYQIIRKLDYAGNELMSINFAEQTGMRDSARITALGVDGNNNIYVGFGQTVYIFTSYGESLFSLNFDGFINSDSLIRLSDGRLTVKATYSSDLRVIDTANTAWGVSLAMPLNAQSIFSGSGGYTYLFSDGIALFGLDLSTGDVSHILSWADIGIMSPLVSNITFTANEHIIFTMQTFIDTDADGAGSILVLDETLLVKLIPTDKYEMHEVTVLTIPAFGFTHDIPRDAISHFNNTNSAYRIEFVEYSDTESFGGFIPAIDIEAQNRLILDILAGNAPDILVLDQRMFSNLAWSGLFVDLYEFIDSDPELSRSDFNEDVFRKTEVGGSLYRVFPYFAVESIFGRPAFVGSTPGWDLGGLRSVIDENPQAEFALGKVHDFEHLFSMLFRPTDFVDWETGSANFDSGSFIELMELLNMYYSKSDVLTERGVHGELIFETDRLIAAGSQIMLHELLTRFTDYAAVGHLFGGDVISKGLPTDIGEKSTILHIRIPLSISATSSSKQGAWKFVRMFLTEDWQLGNADSHFFGFPTNRAAFDYVLRDSMSFEGTRRVSAGHHTASVEALSQNDIDRIMEIIDSAAAVPPFNQEELVLLVLEGVVDYINGLMTARDATRIIQNRAAIFVSERVR